MIMKHSVRIMVSDLDYEHDKGIDYEQSFLNNQFGSA